MRKRRLNESKEDLELAVVKSLDKAPLTLTEIQELEILTVRDLMSDHDLDYVLAGRVKSHVQNERLRLQAQDQQNPGKDFKSDFTSLTRSNPTAKKADTKLTESKLRSLVQEILDEETRG